MHYRRLAAAAGALAVLTAAMVAGCSAQAQQPSPPADAPTTTLNPGGPNSFSPGVKAPGAPTALPGNVITG